MGDAVAWGLGVLAVWRLTHLLWAEDGPGQLVLRLRQRAGAGWLGQLLDCFYCLSLWTALPVTGALVYAQAAEVGSVAGAFELSATAILRAVVGWLALSGGAILLERVTAWRGPAAAIEVREELPRPAEDDEEDMKRRQERGQDPAETGPAWIKPSIPDSGASAVRRESS